MGVGKGEEQCNTYRPSTNRRVILYRLLHHANKRHSVVMTTPPMNTPHTPREGSRWHTLDIRMNNNV